MELKRPAEALASCDKALALKPDYVEAWNNRGNALLVLERHDDALASYDKALALRPNHAKAHFKRGSALKALRRFDEALAAYDKALALQPDYAEALMNRGLVLMTLKRPDEALASYDQALALRPRYAEALNNRGVALRALKRPADALAFYDRALALRADYGEAWNNRSNALKDLKRVDDALASLGRALAIDPDNAEARWGDSLCHLLAGDLPRGWQGYEWRWKAEPLKHERRDFPRPLWLGDADVAGKTVLLHAEQGLGDTIQFCRYAPMVAALGARVVLEVQPPLKSLLGRLDGVHAVIAKGEPLPDFDLHCPLLSLPLAFKTTLETVPAHAPYIKAAPELVEAWRARLGPSAAPRIGLVWAGNPNQANDHNRSMPVSHLAPLMEIEGTLFSLQKELRVGDQDWLDAHPRVRPLGAAPHDFADTAALLSLMDVVIAVDTAVAHLAGAMGKPVYIALAFAADWRWLLERADCPWYPTARRCRQPAIDDWASVVAALVPELKRLAAHL